MNFVANKDEAEKEQEVNPLKGVKGIVKCRYCKEDHWTTQCPYKDTLEPLRESLIGPSTDEADSGSAAAPAAAGGPAGGGGAGGKYVPPSRRGGMSDAQARIQGDSMPDRRPREETAAIRVSNLSENVQEQDLQVSVHVFSCITIVLSNSSFPINLEGFIELYYAFYINNWIMRMA